MIFYEIVETELGAGHVENRFKGFVNIKTAQDNRDSLKDFWDGCGNSYNVKSYVIPTIHKLHEICEGCTASSEMCLECEANKRFDIHGIKA